MGKTITLNGATFEVHRSSRISEDMLHRYSGRTLSECYTNPSKIKREIYKEWFEWAELNDIDYFGVLSYNAHRFSLQGMVEHLGHTYILIISASSNKAYMID